MSVEINMDDVLEPIHKEELKRTFRLMREDSDRHGLSIFVRSPAPLPPDGLSMRKRRHFGGCSKSIQTTRRYSPSSSSSRTGR